MKKLIAFALFFAATQASAFGGGIVKIAPNTVLQGGESVTISVECSTGTAPSPLAVWVPFQSYKLVDATISEMQYSAPDWAFDGNPDTIWHTAYKTATPSMPHHIAVDLQVSFDLSKFKYLPRQDTQPGGRVKDYAIYISKDGMAWGDPVAVGTFENTNAEQIVSFPVTTGRYFKFESRSEHAGGPYTSAAEIAVFGSLTKMPRPAPTEPTTSTTKTWVVHDNGRTDRPTYVLDSAGSLVINSDKTQRAAYGEPCGDFVGRVGTTQLEYRRLVRNRDLVSICVGK